MATVHRIRPVAAKDSIAMVCQKLAALIATVRSHWRARDVWRSRPLRAYISVNMLTAHLQARNIPPKRILSCKGSVAFEALELLQLSMNAIEVAIKVGLAYERSLTVRGWAEVFFPAIRIVRLHVRLVIVAPLK